MIVFPGKLLVTLELDRFGRHRQGIGILTLQATAITGQMNEPRAFMHVENQNELALQSHPIDSHARQRRVRMDVRLRGPAG